MKKRTMNYLKSKLEKIWLGGEFFLIYTVWAMTGNLAVILSIKLLSILFSEEIFHEEIEGRPKRILWHILSFLGYIVAFSLSQTGHVVMVQV